MPAQQQSDQQRQERDRRAAAIAAALGVYVAASGAAAGATAAGGGFVALNAAMLRALTRLFLRWRYDRRVIRWVTRYAIRVTMSYAPAEGAGDAADAYARAARIYAAWFLEAATARLQAAVVQDQTDGTGSEHLDAQMAAEDRYADQHLQAQKERQDAARAVDVEAAKPGQVTSTEPDPSGGPGRRRVILRWRAHPDDRTTPECRAADGAWFYADTPPIIGYPGMPHGGTCRCWSANAGSLAEVARGRSVDDSVRGIITREPDYRPHPVVAPGEQQEAS